MREPEIVVTESISIKGYVSDELRKHILESNTDEEGRIKWEQTILYINETEKVTLNKYGNECVIENFDEDDRKFIHEATSDFFSIAYF